MGLELKPLTREMLLASTANQLGLVGAEVCSDELPIALLAGILRRIAVTTCPCPREALVSCAVDALTGFGVAETIKLRVLDVLESLIVIGDLLELGGTMSLPGVVAEDWVYCAPPAFVIRQGSLLLLGIEPEDQASMSATLRARVVRQHELRYLRTDDDHDDVAAQLRVAGYLEISNVAWSRFPRNQSAEAFVDDAIRRLQTADGHGALEGLQVYGPPKIGRPFASRLGPPGGFSGFYVGRRPQAFGAPIWVFVELDQGRSVRFLDLPWRGGRFRGCDHGWRIQSALDARAGRPQTYRVTPIDGNLDCYEFFSPLPLWIERKLRIHGEKTTARDALFAYALDRHCNHDVDDLVQSYMWFQQTD